jgi:DNA-binding transcriptional ArsR family regulator
MGAKVCASSLCANFTREGFRLIPLHIPIMVYIGLMARTATTADVFNAVGDHCRRDILDVIARDEATVGEIVDRLGLGQPQVSKHLKVLRDVGVVRCRVTGRQRFYRVHPPALAPMQMWLAGLTAAVNERYDRLDDYLAELQTHPTTETEQ